MAYVAPVITASGKTFAQHQGLGAFGHIEAVIAANGSLNAFQVGVIRSLYNNNQFGDNLLTVCINYLNGQAMTVAEVAQRVKDLATVCAVLLTACNEIATLYDANQGTLKPDPTRGNQSLYRTFP